MQRSAMSPACLRSGDSRAPLWLPADGCAQIRAQLHAQRAEFGGVPAGAHQRALQSYECLACFAFQAFDRFGLDLCRLDHDPRRQRAARAVNRIGLSVLRNICRVCNTVTAPAGCGAAEAPGEYGARCASHSLRATTACADRLHRSAFATCASFAASSGGATTVSFMVALVLGAGVVFSGPICARVSREDRVQPASTSAADSWSWLYIFSVVATSEWPR